MTGSTAPPADLAGRTLQIEVIPAGHSVFRLHQTAFAPRHFGRSGLWRFDDPVAAYGVLYVALSRELAFAETLLRGTGSVVAETELELRSLATFRVTSDLRLVRLHGASMRAMGADASSTAGPYATSQLWSAALHAHPEAPDGIVYRGTRDNDERAIALFERASGSIDEEGSVPLMSDPTLLGRLLDHYEAGLV